MSSLLNLPMPLSTEKLLGSLNRKLDIDLAPNIRADIATKYLYSHLLKTLKQNEHGTVENTNSEYLHNFRVAVRRTRAGLNQLKGVLPEQKNTYFSEFFSWLGQITSTTRDLDVYLLNFPTYKDSLPVSIQDDLNPLYELLLIKQSKAQKELARKLRSPHYSSVILEWEAYLKQQSPMIPVEANAKLSIKQLADRRIFKNYKRVLKEGDLIDKNSPSEALHELRKSCKKLRYLMEFFQSLYPDNLIKPLIKNLKSLQDVLGDFQDYAVQINTLNLFKDEMYQISTHTSTLLAMAVLIENLERRKIKSRKEFSGNFDTFKHPDNHNTFKNLFNHKII